VLQKELYNLHIYVYVSCKALFEAPCIYIYINRFYFHYLNKEVVAVPLFLELKPSFLTQTRVKKFGYGRKKA
jgi:hypothetical protein